MRPKPTKTGTAEALRVLDAAGMPDSKIATLIGVGERAVRYWRSGNKPHPRAYQQLLALAAREGVA